MSQVSRDSIERALEQFQDSNVGTDLVTSGAVREIDVGDDGGVRVRLVLGYPAKSWHVELEAGVRERLTALDGVREVRVEVATEVASHAVQSNLQPLPGVKNIIAIASGKGGVGKSTTAVNLALALTAEGARTGLLDADIYGPSQPRMVGYSGRPRTSDRKTLEPVERHGLQVMSVGFLVDEETPMIWRGPMVTQALNQLLNDTRWHDLDYLVVDLPPGTGDIQLTLAQRIPVSGAIIVTTPQDIALLDARKGLRMFEKVEVAVLGIVENMSTHICSNCGHEEHIFGAGGGARIAEQYHTVLLGELPLDIRIREQTDSGIPTVVAEPDSPLTAAYLEIARRTAGRLAAPAGRERAAFPEIVIADD